jgi:hypothetical protein
MFLFRASGFNTEVKTAYKVKVVVKIGEHDSECFADAYSSDDHVDDNIERDVKFETMEEFIQYRVDHPDEFAEN